MKKVILSSFLIVSMFLSTFLLIFGAVPYAKATLTSTNVVFVPSASCPHGGTLPTTDPAFAAFSFSTMAWADMNAANLAPYDTVVLMISTSTVLLNASQQTDLINWVDGGGKLIIYDSETVPGVDYSWLPHPMTTLNPGAEGYAGGNITFVENNTLGCTDPGNVTYYIDTTIVPTGGWSDGVGDCNIFVTSDPHWYGDIKAQNYFSHPQSPGYDGTPAGWVHTYAKSPSGNGLFIYNGFDIDPLRSNSVPDPTVAGDGNLAKIWLMELQQPWGADFNLPCSVCARALIPVSSGTSVTVYEQTTAVYCHTFSVSVLTGTGGTFHTSAKEYYTVSSDGVCLKIHCLRTRWLSGFAVGNNIVAAKLNGVPGHPNGLWATEVIDYTLGYNGMAESMFNALGNDTAVGPFAGSLCTYMGDQHSELVLGFSIVGHDIAINSVEPSTNIVGGSTLPINVTVTNRGEVAESFNVTTYFDSTAIETQTVSGLDPMASKTLTFNWNTTDVPYGKYTIKAEASVVPGETKINNNILIDGTVRVAYPHDVAVVRFTPSPSGTTVSQNLTIYGGVEVENQGLQTETFNVTVYANSTTIGTQTVSSLASGTSVTLTFNWNTTTFAAGNYVIKATADTVPGEIDTADNTLIDGTVTVTLTLPSPIIISNGILEAIIESSPGLDGVGTYTIRTGPNHPNPGQNVFYDGAFADPWSTYNTIHVNTTEIEYVTTTSAPMPDPGYAVVAMDTLLPPLLPAIIFTSTKVTITWWTFEPLLVVQEIEITGTTVSDTNVRVTMNVTNFDYMQHLIGIRYEWDIMVDGWDGSWVRTWASGAPSSWLDNETEWTPPTYEYWETTNYPLNPLFYIYGSTLSPAGSTPPDKAIFAHWGSSYAQAYSYTPTGQVIGGTVPSTGGQYDSTMLYYWNFTLDPHESRNVTAFIWVPTIHDVAITNVTVSEKSVHHIYVDVMNQGTEPETFNITVLTNSTTIGTQTVSSLAPGTHLNLTFDWDTTTFNPGNYTISVGASIVPYEIDITDNTYIDGTVTVTAPTGVGGVWVPVDKFGLLAPYIALASTILVATAATAIYVKRVKRRKKKQ